MISHDTYDFGSQAYLAAVRGDDFCILLAHLRVVGDSGRGDMQATQSRAVGLDRSQLLLVEEAQPADSIRLPSPAQLFQSAELVFLRGHDKFSADLMRYSVLLTEGDHLLRALDGGTRFHGQRSIINPGVNDTAISSALVSGQPLFFFEEQ